MKDSKIFLIDGSSYIYRAFHAIPFLSNRKGLPTNAVYGFTQMLLRLLKDYKPERIVIAFDTKGATIRHDAYKAYKATRPEMPSLLKPQIPYIKDIVRAFNIAALELNGYEADDIIGTLASRFRKRGGGVIIVSGDKDLMQLIDRNTTMVDPMKGKIYDVEKVKERFGGVEPGMIVDIMALAGDASDNIPGVPGIGERTAVRLIKEFGSLDRLYTNIDKVKGNALKERLKNNRHMAVLSRRLAVIERDVPLRFDIDNIFFPGPDRKRLASIFKELEFTRLLKDVMADDTSPGIASKIIPWTIVERADLEILSNLLPGLERAAISLKIGRKMDASSDIAMAIFAGPDSNDNKDKSLIFLSTINNDFDAKTLLEHMRAFLEDDNIKKISNNAKDMYILSKTMGIGIKGIDMDVSVASYLLNPSTSDHSIDRVAVDYLGVSLMKEGKKDFKSMDGDNLCNVLCEESIAIHRLYPMLLDTLKDHSLLSLFRDIEMPLISVLARMEMAGVNVDKEYLLNFSKELEVRLLTIAEDIYRLAGCKFNINSSRQLSDILFKKLNLRPSKKTKTGLSTNEEVLKILSKEHDLPLKVLEYRHLSKLKSTYVDSLIGLINPVTGRVHTSFNQTVTATGRLSSSKPNLQNIPIKSEMGRRIRRSFIAEDGWLLISADYSQIELRIVAHLSNDEILVDAFKRGEDIHKRTASEIFEVLQEDVTGDMRRRAKAINFGIIYGMGSYGLANELGISKSVAAAYIESYFSRYKGIRKFMETTIQRAREDGYTTTIFGRKRYVPELGSDIEAIRRFGERIAINTPVQGSSADIIKVAMINLTKRFDEQRLNSRMILQIHDELLFEAPEEEVKQIQDIIAMEMESVVDLRVPIKVNILTGKNWLETG